MKNAHIKRLALVLACQAELEGMKAEGVRGEKGASHRSYRGEDFDQLADRLKELASLPDEYFTQQR